jgi:hypothetical protein
MITAPMIDELGSPPSHENRAGRVHFVDQLSGRPGRPKELPVWSDASVVQPFAAVSKAAAEFIVGAGDVPVESSTREVLSAASTTVRPTRRMPAWMRPDARPAGPAPTPPAEPLRVDRQGSCCGALVIAGQLRSSISRTATPTAQGPTAKGTTNTTSGESKAALFIASSAIEARTAARANAARDRRDMPARGEGERAGENPRGRIVGVGTEQPGADEDSHSAQGHRERERPPSAQQPNREPVRARDRAPASQLADRKTVNAA